MDKKVELFNAVVIALKARLESGEASAGDMKNAIEFLKNNGITFDNTDEKTPADVSKFLPELPYNKKFEEAVNTAGMC